MKVVGLVASLLSVATAGCEWWKDPGNGRDIGEQVSDDVSLNAKFEGKVPRTGWVFKATGLYFFFITKVMRGVSEGEGGRNGCDRQRLLETSAS